VGRARRPQNPTIRPANGQQNLKPISLPDTLREFLTSCVQFPAHVKASHLDRAGFELSEGDRFINCERRLSLASVAEQRKHEQRPRYRSIADFDFVELS
jgi:hypothetical protein